MANSFHFAPSHTCQDEDSATCHSSRRPSARSGTADTTEISADRVVMILLIVEIVNYINL